MRAFWILLLVALARGVAAATCNATLPCDCPACTACGLTPITFKPRCLGCIKGWGMNRVTGVCVKCTAGAGCVRCNGRFPGVCTACRPGWTLVKGVCKSCWPGSNGCAKCTKNADGTERCSQCLSNRFINSGARAGPGLGWHSGLGKVPS